MKEDTSIYSDILRHIKTVNQAEEFSLEIDSLLSGLFQTKQSFEQVLDKSISAQTKELLKKGLEKSSPDLKNIDYIKSYLNSLKDELHKLKAVKLSLAFSPSEETIDNIFDWVCENLGKDIILDIHEHGEILGGAIIDFEGQYRDFSLKKSLGEIFEKNKKEIWKNLLPT